MRKVVLYRGKEFEDDELAAARDAGFICTNSRMDIKPGDLVIGRYSMLPYYEEQECDIKKAGAQLINTHHMHSWIADVGAWACEGGALEGLTPRTWERWEDVPDGIELVLKGKTNSRKHLWNTHMHASDKKRGMEVYCRLLDDTMIGQQTIYIREYVPLTRLMTGFNGLPITKEFRFFVYKGVVLSGGYYWSSHVADLEKVPSPAEVPDSFLAPVVQAVCKYANFVVIDVAQKEDGSWIVIELNDGQQSGLSENNPVELYQNLAYTLAYEESNHDSLL